MNRSLGFCLICFLYHLTPGNGARGFVCSDVYYGEAPFSELEHQDVSQYLYDLKDNKGVEFVHFIDFHTYSQLLLSPWSYSETVPNPVDYTDHVSYFMSHRPFGRTPGTIRSPAPFCTNNS